MPKRKYQNDPLDDLPTETGPISAPIPPVSGEPIVDRPPKSTGGRRRKVTREMALAVVSAINLPLSVIPLTKDDALEDTEISALAVAIEDTARANKWFANIILNIVTLQSTAELGIVVSAIVVKRLARREKLPIMAAFGAETVIASVASRGASVTGRANGKRQDDTSQGTPASPEILYSGSN